MKLLRILIGLSLVGACTQGGDGATAANVAAPADAVEATAAEHAGDAPAATPISEVAPAVPVLEQEIAYGASSERNFVGYLVMPADVVEPIPGIIMIHEWWGLNENIRAMARRLSGEGYAVLAVDLYGGQVAETPTEAQALMAETMRARDSVLENIAQAYEYLDQSVLAPRIATLGWCLGGGFSLEAGLSMGELLDAVVMYYGQVTTDTDRLDSLDAPLLGLFAELDESIPVRDVQRFRSTLRDLGKNAEVLIYSDVDHAFANPSGGAYDQQAAEEAWETTIQFLERQLK
ncbi:MAG: dienelactone hydrolase family protein [Gammaproteobacteria bacterium]|nr:dienelactone hydrolase family protein [Gammaproteobacteria bacterium]